MQNLPRTSSIPGPKIILIGDSGTGKTHALQTLLACGITPFIIFTEPGMEVLGDVLDKCKWRYLPPRTPSWGGLLSIAKSVSTLDFKGLTLLRDANKSQYTGVLDFIEQCNHFVDSNGEDFGDVLEWGTDRALVMDSLTGYSDMASQLVVGGKPLKSQGEYQVAQNMIRFVLDKLVKECRCTFIMTCHIAREHDEITGGTTLMVKTVGKALAPDIPIYFSDVIQTIRHSSKFTWDNSGSNIMVSARNLPIKAGQIPSFKPLFEGWKKRGGVIEKSVESTTGSIPAPSKVGP